MKNPFSTRIFTAPAPKFIIQDHSVNHASKGSEFIDAHGSEYSADTVRDDATPFDTAEAAQGFIDVAGYPDCCAVVPMPTNDVFLYRADWYRENMGDLRGFFLTKEDAMHALRVEADDEGDYYEGNFGQISLFSVAPSVLDGVDLADNTAMLSDSIWGNGNIIEDFYYKA